MPGPQPTPTKILAKRGSWRAKTRGGEPSPESGHPSLPAELDDRGRKEWFRIVPQLEASGILADCDRAALSAYCQSWSMWLRYTKAFNKLAAKKLNTPEAKRLRAGVLDTQHSMMKCAAVFGLSPADRTRIRMDPDKRQDDGKARFFNDVG